MKGRHPYGTFSEPCMTSAVEYVSSFVSTTRRMVGSLQTRGGDASLDDIRSAMVEQVIDCPPQKSRRARTQVTEARSAQQLWLLRGEIYQVIADELGQFEAERRIAVLVPLFSGHLPARRGALRRRRG